MLICGDNEIIMNKLLKTHAGKIQLAYADPPYNRDGDFPYVDKFDKSVWLDFMERRLTLVKELLHDTGTIFISIDDSEQAELKLLMNKIFGEENFISQSIVISNRHGLNYGEVSRMHEYLLIYGKTADAKLNRLVKQGFFQHYDDIGGFNLMDLQNRNVMFNESNRPNLRYPFYVDIGSKDQFGLYSVILEEKPGFQKVFPRESRDIKMVWRWGMKKAASEIDEIKAKRKQDGNYMIVNKYRKNESMQHSIWDDKEFRNERGTLDQTGLFGKRVFPYPKSEFLISRIITLGSNLGDLVLDFHMGSGTTPAVCHKTGRKYIGIEKSSQSFDLAKTRIEKVIKGDKTGISKLVGWRGGGTMPILKTLVGGHDG